MSSNPIRRVHPARLPSLRSSPSIRSSPVPQPLPSARRVRPCPGCTNPDIGEQEGQLVCFNCGTVVSDSVIVNDVTFGEAPSGAALVQGTTVHEGQRYAKPTGAFRRGGRSSEDASESSLRAGRDEMNRLANSLYITKVVDRAFRLYQMARVHQFHRPVSENVAICLYVACRQTKGNTTLLIDFAEKIRQNVFELGATYKKFIKAIGLADELEKVPAIEIEPLLYRFAKRLEFGHATLQVANDAASILARMDRDWIVTGRQPQALCGASLILAARMNNFRRSIREVVYVVKAGDATILKRMEEFRRTKAGRMTVAQFRQFGRLLKEQHDPPALYKAKEREEENIKRQKRSSSSATRSLLLGESTATADDVAVAYATASPQGRQRRDGDGFLIPKVPVDPSLRPTRSSSRLQPATRPHSASASVEPDADDGSDGQHPRKRRRKVKPEPLVISEEDLQAEEALEAEIGHVVEKHINDDAFEVTHVRARAIAKAELEKEVPSSIVPDTEIIGLDEFDDDPEVSNCLLSTAEIEVKEKIWVTHNHDWLRAQQERMLDKAMDEAKGKKKRQNKRKQIRKPGSIVDETPVSSPAEASQRMLEKRSRRAAFSRHINYDKLQSIYGLGESSAGSPTPSIVSEATSVRASPTPATPQSRFQISRTQRAIPVMRSPSSGTQAGPSQGGSGTKKQPLEIVSDGSSDEAVSEVEEIEEDAEAGASGFQEHYSEADEDGEDLAADDIIYEMGIDDGEYE